MAGAPAGDPLRRVVLARLVVLLFVAAAPASAAAQELEEAVPRIHTLLNLVAEEYREGVVVGELVRPREYDEASIFLEDARRRWERAAAAAGEGGDGDAGMLFGRIKAVMAARADAAQVAGLVEALQARITERTGIAPQVFPPQAPSVARGRTLFETHCVSCHGAAGDGHGPQAAMLFPPPSNFTDADFMAAETPYDFFHVITAGRVTAGMPAWGEVLGLQDRWDLVAYLWTFRANDVTGGRALYGERCAGCHGALGEAGPIDLRQTATLARLSDAEIGERLHEGTPGTALRPLAGRAADVAALTFHVRMLATADGTAAGGGRAALVEAATLLDGAVASWRAGDARAADLALDAYLAYERVERRVGLAAPEVNRRLEHGFGEMRELLQGGAPEAAIVGAVADVRRDLAAAAAALEPRRGRTAAFAQSITIIVREGFEALLIIAALAAYVRRAGHPRLGRHVYGGAVLGLVASLFTAWVFVRVLAIGAAGQEILEGGTMLLAAAVLFFVSYWLVSRAEAEHWQRYIRGRVDAALARGSTWALGGAAFLAVYREGAETVLFYQALLGTTAGARDAVAAGFVCGAVALAFLYLLTFRLGVRVPVRPFFLGTGFVLYYMAFAFAGRGIAELQEAGVVARTPLAAWPDSELLGTSPSIEVAAVQIGLLVAALAAVLVLLARRRPAAEGAPAGTADHRARPAA